MELLDQSSTKELKILQIKIKNLDSVNDASVDDFSADDQPNSEDVRTVQLIQVRLYIFPPFITCPGGFLLTASPVLTAGSILVILGM